MKYWSIFQALALVSVCAWQVYHLKVRTSSAYSFSTVHPVVCTLLSGTDPLLVRDLGQAFFETKRTI